MLRQIAACSDIHLAELEYKRPEYNVKTTPLFSGRSQVRKLAPGSSGIENQPTFSERANTKTRGSAGLRTL